MPKDVKDEPLEKQLWKAADKLRKNIDPARLGGLIDLVCNIALGDAKAPCTDVLGTVFKYTNPRRLVVYEP